MSSGMNMAEAEEIAKKMTYRDAVNNALRGRCVPYKKATRIKLNELLEKLEEIESEDKNMADEYVVKKNPSLIDIKVIEDIKAEIESICENTTYPPDDTFFRIVVDEDYFLGLEYAIKIIDKHIGKENNG